MENGGEIWVRVGSGGWGALGSKLVAGGIIREE